MHTVTIALIVLGRVDAALCRNRVGTTRRVVEGERINLIAELGERRSSRGTRQTGADDDDLELALVVGVDQLGIGLEVVPLVGQDSCRHF